VVNARRLVYGLMVCAGVAICIGAFLIVGLPYRPTNHSGVDQQGDGLLQQLRKTEDELRRESEKLRTMEAELFEKAPRARAYRERYVGAMRALRGSGKTWDDVQRASPDPRGFPQQVTRLTRLMTYQYILQKMRDPEERASLEEYLCRASVAVKGRTDVGGFSQLSLQYADDLKRQLADFLGLAEAVAGHSPELWESIVQLLPGREKDIEQGMAEAQRLAGIPDQFALQIQENVVGQLDSHLYHLMEYVLTPPEVVAQQSVVTALSNEYGRLTQRFRTSHPRSEWPPFYYPR